MATRNTGKGKLRLTNNRSRRMQHPPGDGTQVLRFAVDVRPVCVWVRDATERNQEFLRRLDPTYFEYIAHVHADHLTADQKLLAALTLRTAYSQALETLFAFLCATAQAPGCAYGWLTQYRNS